MNEIIFLKQQQIKSIENMYDLKCNNNMEEQSSIVMQ